MKMEFLLDLAQEAAAVKSMKAKKKKKTYNSRYSLVVTDPTTNQPLRTLCCQDPGSLKWKNGHLE